MMLIKKILYKIFKKRGEKNEKIYNDFCECYFSSNDFDK